MAEPNGKEGGIPAVDQEVLKLLKKPQAAGKRKKYVRKRLKIDKQIDKTITVAIFLFS